MQGHYIQLNPVYFTVLAAGFVQLCWTVVVLTGWVRFPG